MPNQLVEAIANMREDEAFRLVEEMIERGEDAARILELCQEAMSIVGQRFESGSYFLPELIMSGEMLKRISELVKPQMAAKVEDRKRLGKVVIGTVRGDIHDIGKDIVTFMLDVNGFEVRDLGIDVPEERFVEAIRDFQPQVVGMSGLLTLAYDSMKATVEAISAAGLRDRVKIMIGGGGIDDTVREYTGADAFGSDALAAVTLSKRWVGAN